MTRQLDDERLRADLEWFLLEAYGMKVVASSSFTAGLVERGILSLGVG